MATVKKRSCGLRGTTGTRNASHLIKLFFMSALMSARQNDKTSTTRDETRQQKRSEDKPTALNDDPLHLFLRVMCSHPVPLRCTPPISLLSLATALRRGIAGSREMSSTGPMTGLSHPLRRGSDRRECKELQLIPIEFSGRSLDYFPARGSGLPP